MSTVPCLRCGQDFTKARTGRPSPFCKPCRRERKTDYNRGRQALIRNDQWGEAVDPRNVEPPHPTRTQTGYAPYVPDCMPEGHSTPAGPYEGVSTWFLDVRAEMAAGRDIALGDIGAAVKAVEAAIDARDRGALYDAVDVVGLTVECGGWWARWRHSWAFKMHDADQAAEYLRAA
jgi:hypothetical protein